MEIRSVARWSLFVVTLFWVGVFASSGGFNSRQQNATVSKIAPWVLEKTAGGQAAEFLVVLAEQADLNAARSLPTKEEKGRHVRDALWNTAQASQAPLLALLQERKVEHRSYYIVNVVWVKGTAELALELAARPDVLRLEGNPEIRNIPAELEIAEEIAKVESPTAIEPGISYVRAPQVWASGFTGQGIVIGGADTGIRWDHPALIGKYRGWNGTAASHDYNWHDSIHSGGGECGPDSPAPCDDNNHGTHTIGTAVGDDGGVNQIGMAPGAKWIGCRNMDQGIGTPARYIECFEFFLAPYPVGGTPAQGEPNLAPDVTNNSWSCPPSEGCSPGTLQAAVEAQRAAGIMMVTSTGNTGPACSTVNTSPATYDAAYSVGALINSTDSAVNFSSRGPVTIDGSMRRKPDLTAPGTSVRSSVRSGGYGNSGGTSMAAPHVTGAVALLWSARPYLRRDVDRTEQVLNSSAVPIFSSTCDGGGTAVSPNNTYGFGRLDAKAAVDQLAILQAVSRKVHGNAGSFDVPLALTGEPAVEPRSGSANTLVITFNTQVVSGSATVTSGTGTAAAPTFVENRMTVELTGVSDAQKITVTLSGVTGTASQVLPDTAISMNVLSGDVNGNKLVSASDIGQVKALSGANVSSTNFRADVAVSGTINASDIGLVKSRSGNSVP